MATNFSPCKGSYVLNQFPSNVMFGMNGFNVSASGAIQGHHGPLVFFKLHLSSAKAFTWDQSKNLSLGIESNLSKTANFRLFQPERICRRQF